MPTKSVAMTIIVRNETDLLERIVSYNTIRRASGGVKKFKSPNLVSQESVRESIRFGFRSLRARK